jgi:hypothetical protein
MVRMRKNSQTSRRVIGRVSKVPKEPNSTTEECRSSGSLGRWAARAGKSQNAEESQTGWR